MAFLYSIATLLLVLLTALPASASSVSIYNDSPFQLKAKVVSSEGKLKGEVEIAPQAQVVWKDPTSGTQTRSQTPYTVIFTCPSGKQFGVVSDVSPGATIRALSSSGDRYCEAPKEAPNKQPSQDSPLTAPPPKQPLQLGPP